MKDMKIPKKEQSERIAQRAIKISLASLMVLFVASLILLAVLITQSDAMAQMSQQIQTLSQELAQIKTCSKPKIL